MLGLLGVISWWGHPHIIISRIAEEMLSKSDRKRLDKIVNYGSMPYQSVAQCSTWQDDLKSPYKYYSMGTWHFADIPFDDEGYTGSHAPKTYNVTQYLLDAHDTMELENTTDPWTIAFHLRSIIHFVGDIHTPHHNIARYTKNFPSGDAGGNGYLLSCNYGSMCTNIHFFWDSAAGKYGMMYPLNDNVYADFKKNVTALKQAHPYGEYDTNDLESWNPNGWSQESADVAIKDGYSTPMYGFPSKEYFQLVQKDADSRIAVAGYRLGTYLVHIMKRKGMPTYSSITGREITIWVLDSLLVIGCVLMIVLQVFDSRKYQVIA